MDRARAYLRALLHPPKGIMRIVPPVGFAALIYVFAAGRTETAAAVPVYCLSAYALMICAAAVPERLRRARAAVVNSRPVQRVLSTAAGDRYLHDAAFRNGVGIYQGMAVNAAYGLFCAVSGVRYASVWFLSMAAYYLVLGGIRGYLAFSFRRREAGGLAYEYRCYRRTAWLLFLLNIPMGGMITLMVLTDSGASYPGVMIYLSALWTFCMAILSAVKLWKLRRRGSPILSAAKVLSVISALMSVLGLQTAMISRFSGGGAFRRRMNAATGGCVYGIVIVLAVYMLISAAAIGRKQGVYEQV